MQVHKFVRITIISLHFLSSIQFSQSFGLEPLKISSSAKKKQSVAMSTNDNTAHHSIECDDLTSLDVPSFKIQRVTCDASKESPYLREGVAELFQLYFEELYDLGCDLGFQGFQTEWTDLPGKYDFNKRGGLFVAIENEPKTVPDSDEPSEALQSSQIVGCIAIRPLTESCGEVKRMYIRKSHRGNGLGKKLALAIIEHAWSDECNFDEIKLDSLERLTAAVSLYEKMGFKRILPYCECPEKDHVCMNTFNPNPN